MKAAIEVFHSGSWHLLAELEAVSAREIARGHLGRAHFVYDDDYALAHLGAIDLRSASCRYPVDFNVHTAEPWPAFMLDILPAGAARRALVASLDLDDNDTADWTLLTEGAGHPPGNLRVVPMSAQRAHQVPGFSRDQVSGRDPEFVEYVCRHRAGVAGTSGAHGESPKFLLTEDAGGLLHADGVLPDCDARRHWLVKWPRGTKESDGAVLRNEAAYMRYAARVGLRVHAAPDVENETLFVERFDRRVADGRVERYGLESLCSLAGVSQYGARIPLQRLAAAVARFSTDPDGDLVELVCRDVLNVALGNTDNHARNSALLKTPDGAVRLSPLYDFAPMILDEAGIPRCCRWTDAEDAGFPRWPEVVELVESIHPTPELRPRLAGLASELERAPAQLIECGADDELIERLARRIDAVRRSLAGISAAQTSAR